MNWLLENKFNARPVVTVEDHVYHISELLRIIQTADASFFLNLTVVCLDRAGPDTDAAVEDWLRVYPDLQIAARIADEKRFLDHASRLTVLPDNVFENQNDYCRQIARFIRPQGLLLQDIELETLEFVARDRWWESTMLASTVRGIVGDRAPRCAFISNKRGYEATFGAELLAAGHDPCDVLNKYELEEVAVPFLTRYLDDNFEFKLRWVSGDARVSKSINSCRVSNSECEKQRVETQLDVVLWPEQNETIEIGGRSMKAGKKRRVTLAAESNELLTWRQLVEARLQDESGVEVQTVGQRVAPSGALRAEATNAAARHIHSLRKRLVDPQAIATVGGNYRLQDGLSVGLVAG